MLHSQRIWLVLLTTVALAQPPRGGGMTELRAPGVETQGNVRRAAQQLDDNIEGKVQHMLEQRKMRPHGRSVQQAAADRLMGKMQLMLEQRKVGAGGRTAQQVAHDKLLLELGHMLEQRKVRTVGRIAPQAVSWSGPLLGLKVGLGVALFLNLTLFLVVRWRQRRMLRLRTYQANGASGWLPTRSLNGTRGGRRGSCSNVQ